MVPGLQATAQLDPLPVDTLPGLGKVFTARTALGFDDPKRSRTVTVKL